MTEAQCQYKIHWTFDADAQCELPHHIDQVIIEEYPDKRYSVTTVGDGHPDTDRHEAHVGPHGTVLHWQAGDRREYTGDWPGACTKLGDSVRPCTLHTGHHGRCAP